MPTVTLSSKHQITLPMEAVRALGLKPGNKLVVELIDDHLILLPQPESWVDYFKGSLKGVYGSTKEEVDRYIAEVRYGWDIDALKDALTLDKQLRSVYEETSFTEARDSVEIAQKTGMGERDVLRCLERLEKLQAVKPILTGKARARWRRIP